MQERGYKVYATSRKLDSMKELVEQGIDTVELDVTNDASIKAALKKIGPVEILVNNAGYGSYGALEDVSQEEARAQFDVNVFGLARLTQLVLPAMRQAGKGTVINVSSVAGRFGEPLGAWYHATKHAVEGLSDSLKMEVEPFGIKVALIEPGGVITEWGSRAAEGLQKASGKSAYASQVPGRAKFLKATSNPRTASPPEVIAQKILKVIEKPNPKFRYPAGKGAHLFMIARRLTTDKFFYGVMRRLSNSAKNV